ncbi:hypothetical protein [Flavobacterium akiainvivens]|nr:hypothetical protein [Flavobacterium akiainvivens]SFQ73011.1 hypothetical protein SAMN05444144_11851 [Flavobacterium akiainvivens]
MKNILFAILLISLAGCGDDRHDAADIESLKKQNAELLKQNKILNDSLSLYEQRFVMSQILIGIPDAQIAKVGKENNIKVVFHPYAMEMPKYDIYEVKGKDEIKVGSSNKTMFEYKFIPKSLKDNEVNLKVKIPFGGRIIETPASMILKVEN